MSVLYILVPIALLFVVLAAVIFFWAVRHDQFEDLERQGSNILFDELDNQPSAKPAKTKEPHDPT